MVARPTSADLRHLELKPIAKIGPSRVRSISGAITSGRGRLWIVKRPSPSVERPRPLIGFNRKSNAQSDREKAY